MRAGRLSIVTICFAALLALSGCGIEQASATASEPMATIKAPLEQTVYTAVDFVGREGLLAGYKETLTGPSAPSQPVAGSGAIWRTADGGRTWRRTQLGNWQVLQIDMVTARAGYLTATNPNSGFAVLRTGDGGRSWRRVLRLAFAPSIVGTWSPAKVLLLSQGELWSTADGGRSWHRVRPQIPGIAAASFTSPLTGYAVAGTRILATDDGGVHWHTRYVLPQSLTVQIGPPTGATIDVPRGGRGWASFTLSTCWPGGCPNVVLHQSPSGRWQIVSGEDAGPLGGIAASEDGFPGGAQGLWSTGPESAVWNGSGGLWQTADGGATWQEIGAPEAHQPSPPFVAVSGVRSGDLWAVGQGAWGGYLLHDTETGWQQVLPQPFPVSAVDFVSREVGYGIGLSWAPHAIVGTRDGGRTWTMLSQIQGSLPIAIDFTSPEHGYLATAGSGGTLLETGDGGRSWQVAAYFQAPPAFLAFRDPLDGAALLETGPGWPLQFVLQETADGGKTWYGAGVPEALSDTLASATPVVVTSAAAIFPSAANGFFLALVGHEPQFWQLIGGRWQALTVPTGEAARGSGPEQYLGAAMAAPAADDVWLTLEPTWSQAAVRVMRLHASSWQIYDLPLPLRLNLPTGSEAVSSFGPGRAVLLTNIGPLLTTDDGRTWQSL